MRNNGSGCPKTSDTTKRYFGTEHGSEIEMIPNALNIKGGSKEPLSISFDDNVGVTITSHQKLTINADDDIIMKTPKNVKITATSQLLAMKTGTSSGFSIETDVHFLSDNVIRNGRDKEAFAAIDNTPPEPVKKPDPPKEEKKKVFDWGKLATNVLAGLAVVAVVTVAAVAIAVTCGAAAPVIGAIAIGAGVAGTAAVASQAISDYKSGEVSDMSTYMAVGAREAFIGAVSGAIFGPFGATEALGGKMLLGGVTNGFESIVRQKLNGEDLNWGTVLFDAGIGAATGGLFHGAGKIFEKASPFVKNAFNKISTEISENTKIAKIALSNMEKGPKSVVLGSNLGNVDEALGRFGKEFKKVKNEIAEGVSEANFSKSKILKMNSFQEDISSILKNEEITLDEFNSMRMKGASELTDEERRIMMKIREQVPTPNSDTTLQKIIDGGKIDNYVKDDDPWNTVGGFITKAQDTKELSTLQEVFDGLALGYKKTPFTVGVDKDYGIIRFKTDVVDKIDIPYGPTMERVGSKAPTDGFDTSPDPFAGHGFTKDMNGNIIPEYTMQYIKPNEGAELYRVNSETGIEELIAKYVDGKFVKIK